MLGKCSCLAHLCFHLQDVVKSSCFVPLEELQLDFTVFSTENYKFKMKSNTESSGKSKNSFESTNTF